jgi:hypothetical protein
VISGVFYIGLGDEFDASKLEAYPPGAVIIVPGNAPHFHWEIRRVRHASNRDGATWTGIPQRERRSAKQGREGFSGRSDPTWGESTSLYGTESENNPAQWGRLDVKKKSGHRRSVFFLTPFLELDSRVIEETARLNESYTRIPLKHLASCQIEGSR